jgi:hypothetical protein
MSSVSYASATAAPAHAAAPSSGWLVGRGFDLHFILGITALAVLSGAIVLREPSLLLPVVILDTWLLGYHHRVSALTRICFDRESLRQHRFLVFWLPPILFAATIALATGVGLWSIITIYVYWQWFHYTRQSYGIAQIYRRRSDGLVDDPEWLNQLAIYLLPLWGILHRSHQAPETFLGAEFRVIPVPAFAVDVAAVATGAVLALWAWRKLAQWRQGRLPVAHTLFMLTHFLVFYVSYLAIESLEAGWIVVNVWHSAQYVVFVWMYNEKRFKSGVDPKAWLLSTLSQRRNIWLYLVVCLAISTAVHASIEVLYQGVAMFLIIQQTINYHHYIVDAVVWKVRKKTLRATLGLAS